MTLKDLEQVTLLDVQISVEHEERTDRVTATLIAPDQRSKHSLVYEPSDLFYKGNGVNEAKLGDLCQDLLDLIKFYEEDSSLRLRANSACNGLVLIKNGRTISPRQSENYELLIATQPELALPPLSAVLTYDDDSLEEQLRKKRELCELEARLEEFQSPLRGKLVEIPDLSFFKGFTKANQERKLFNPPYYYATYSNANFLDKLKKYMES